MEAKVKTILEKWTQKYKKSIDCSNPKGFSQRAHCQGKKKKINEDLRRWFKEKWTAQDGSKCGEYKGRGRVKCRPSRRVSEKSPQTWSEMSPEQKKKAVRLKQRAHREGKQFSSHKSGKTWDGKKNKYRPGKKKMNEDVIRTGENPGEYRNRLLANIRSGDISKFDNHDRVHGALAYIDSIRDNYTGSARNIPLVIAGAGDKGGKIGYIIHGIAPSGKHLIATPAGKGGGGHNTTVEHPIKSVYGLQVSSYPNLRPEHREVLRRLMDFKGIREETMEQFRQTIIEKFVKKLKDKGCGCDSSLNEEKEKKPYKGFKKGKNHPEGGLSRSEARRQGIHAGIETKDEAKRKGGFNKLSKKTQARRKSFCARMCGMKRRRTSSKTARDPKSKINAALRVWGCRCGTNESYESDGIFLAEGKNKPTNSKLWSRAKALARSKFKVYPSAYANAWASKWYKKKGGGWRSTVSEEKIDPEKAEQYVEVKPMKKGTRPPDKPVLGDKRKEWLRQQAKRIADKRKRLSEEIVNARHAGTMTSKEKKKRDSLAKRVKGIRPIKKGDSEQNAKYRYATYLVLRSREGKGDKSEKKERKKSSKKKKKTESK